MLKTSDRRSFDFSTISILFLHAATTDGITQSKAKHFFLERYEKAYHNELLHFMESYHQGIKPSVDISDGVLALKIAEAATKSLKSGLPENL